MVWGCRQESNQEYFPIIAHYSLTITSYTDKKHFVAAGLKVAL